MRGDKFRYNKSILYPTILNLAHLKSLHQESGGCTIRDVFDSIPIQHVSLKCVQRTFEMFMAKGIIQQCDDEQVYAKQYNLTNLGRMLLSKCNAEMVILYDSITAK